MNPRLLSLFSPIILLASCGREINLNEFPAQNFKKVVAYKMTGEEGEVVENGKISNKVLGKGELLTDSESRELLKILHNKSTYGEVIYLCFEPHIGYVFYGGNNEIVAHSSICLKCNWMKKNPDIGEFVFSEKGSKRLAEIEKKIFEK